MLIIVVGDIRDIPRVVTGGMQNDLSKQLEVGTRFGDLKQFFCEKSHSFHP